ncbi:hypothetical protein [Enterobacter phage vB-EclM_KMB20]|jgi:hypothetical protein|uniref:Uncharacterized protein n=2 Tax=Karamvirus TaxID=1913650 RepID=A0A5B9NG37_9CAUD|nr:hypothetical protein CC31p135 [Enterobacter phage CC31]ADB81631.1 conserved hypothetical protein [Enterobacter phage CC31]QEG13174.1 hypothetical protein KAALPHA_137 [Klebsiella phage vB_KaeM_KaAlpha]ULA52634.1 hypothetical protein [Enterobacter phage vB-EclM_KMB20]
MSCPATIFTSLNGEINGSVHHNWGWIPPSDYEVATKVLRIVENVPGELRNGELAAKWDKLYIPPFGNMLKEKYWDMYDTLKNIHYGLMDRKDFKLSDFLEEKV